MWLGLSAVATALCFALVKFFTALHMGRLRERHMRLLYDIKRERTRVQSLEGRLQVETSRRGAVEQKLANARRFRDELHDRLRAELPEHLQVDLHNCIHRHAVPEPAGVRVVHQLGLAEKITSALEQLSILVIELPVTGADVITGDLVRRLDEEKLKYSGPAPDDGTRTITTAFDHPEDAMAFLRATFGTRDGNALAGVRGVLMAGTAGGGPPGEQIDRLFARTLHTARTLLGSAPEEGLLINHKAREQITDAEGLEGHSRAEGLWHLSWTALAGAPRPDEGGGGGGLPLPDGAASPLTPPADEPKTPSGEDRP